MKQYDKKIKISAVSYLNTKPFLYGIFKSELNKRIELQLDIPSVCADKLKSGNVDIGLVPVAILPELESYEIISDYCIGTVGAVKTVCIYSNCPIREMTHVFLDYHSRTSVELAKILFKEYWQIDPVILPSKPGFIDKIDFTRGGLVIGDRTIGLDKRFPYVYDLGEIWLKHTGLPFVFAVWVAISQLDDAFIEKFNIALKTGIDEIDELLYILPEPERGFDLKKYYLKNISYFLDKNKKAALNLFLEKMEYYLSNVILK